MMEPISQLAGAGFRTRTSGVIEPIDHAQMFFYENGNVSGSFVCKTAESHGVMWLFQNGASSEKLFRFDMVHVELAFSRDPVASFVGEYDGDGFFAGVWSSPNETGDWLLTMLDFQPATRTTILRSIVDPKEFVPFGDPQ